MSARSKMVILAGALLCVLVAVSAVGSVRDRAEASRITQKMKTVCVGRFLIDVPEAAAVSLSRAVVDGFDIATRAENDAEFNQRLAAREVQINASPNELGKQNLEFVQPVRGNGFFGKIFVFGRSRTSWVENDKQMDTEGVAIDGYIHANDVSFSFTSSNYDPALVGNLPKLLAQFVERKDHEIPADPGFCIDHALLHDPLTADQAEGVTMFAGLPGHPDLAIVFSSMAGTKRGQGMLARSAAASARLPVFARAAFRNLRKGPRAINGLLGEELAVKVKEGNLTTGFSFDWEMGGREDNVLAPLLTLELQTGISPRAGGKPVQSSLSEAALLSLWSKISSSIRVRPTATRMASR